MIKPIMFGDYDKLTDDIIYLGSKLYLRMVVQLSTKYEKDGVYRRASFHKEFRYDSKYSNSKLLSMKRSFEYFLSFEKTDVSGGQGTVLIRPQDMILLRMKLDEVSSWFQDDTFATKNKQLIIYKRKSPVIISGLIFGKYLQFDPVVLVWEQTGIQQPGVRVTLGDQSIYADISVDKFYGLLYSIQSINMYESAQLLINYLQRPEYGTNMVEFEENKFLEPIEKDMQGTDNRQIKPKKRSFFDKMNDL